MIPEKPQLNEFTNEFDETSKKTGSDVCLFFQQMAILLLIIYSVLWANLGNVHITE